MKPPVPETLALASLSACDVILTHHVLLLGGMELNPLGNLLINQFGFWGMVLIKIPLLLVAGWALLRWSRYSKAFHVKYTKAIRFLDYLMIAIVIWNAIQLSLM